MNKRKERFQDVRRLRIIIVGVLAFWIVLVIRLVHIQLVNKRMYVEMGIQQYVQEEKLESSRGIIYDRNLACLAINQPVISIGVDLRKMLNPKRAAMKLSQYVKKSERKLFKEFSSSRSFVWLVREVDEKLADSIMAEKVPGVYIIKESKRFYPHKHVAAQLVGFTGIDEQGLSGVELTYDTELQGKSGKVFIQQDAFGVKQSNVNFNGQQPQAGKDVVLTINATYQSIVEEELRQSVHAFGADGGIVVMLNPQNGEILSLACEPGFDANKARTCAPDLWRNRTVTDVFEPGSTYKIVLMSAIIQEGIKNLNDEIFCENGRYEILSQVVRDHKGYGKLALGDVLINSSNIGMGKLSKKIDPNIFYKYARDFGFGNLTNIELGGEIAGELKHPVDWSDFTSIAMAMGYEVAVSPIQLAMAYAAVANGGKLLKPQIVSQVGENVKAVQQVKPAVIRQVLTPGTAKIMRDLLQQVVERGTATKAKIEGLPICGKTGTARKYAMEARSYSSSEFLASFVGFYPANNPEILICTMIDNPRTTYWGGEVAAPTFKRIVQRLINLENRYLPDTTRTRLANKNGNGVSKKQLSVLPDFKNRSLENSRYFLSQWGIKTEVLNQGQVIVSQEPKPGTPITENMNIHFSLFQINDSDTSYSVTPKLIGLSLREAVNRLTLANLHAEIHGNGQVIKQNPGPGQRLKAGESCRLDCKTRIRPELFSAW